MAGIVGIAAAGIFAIGIMAGIIAVVSHGIHREHKLFRQERRFRKEHGLWAGPDAVEYFLAEQAPDGVTWAARRVNGLHVRHLTSAIGHGADLDVRFSPQRRSLTADPPAVQRPTMITPVQRVIHSQPIVLDVHPSRPQRRPDDGQTILKSVCGS